MNRCGGCIHYSEDIRYHPRTELPIGIIKQCALNLTVNIPYVCHLREVHGVGSLREEWINHKWGPPYPKEKEEKSWNKDMPWYKKELRR